MHTQPQPSVPQSSVPQPSVPQPSVVVIGNFDGVHRGHRQLLSRARAEAPALRLVVVTFWPHPASVIAPGKEPELITTLDDRIALLKQAGADEVRVVPFTHDLMGWSPAQFVELVLLPLNPEVVVVGTNFTFGARAAGTVATLSELGGQMSERGRGAEHTFRVVPVDLVNVGGVTTCSTQVRSLLAAGEVAEAAEHLGRPFRYLGTVVMGHQRGRELGFPTANLPVEAGHVSPADGIYAGWLTRLDEPDAAGLPAAISVGTNPTFDDVPERVVEAHVLDRDDLELYGVRVAVDFIDRLRGNLKFGDLDELVAQINSDVAETRRRLSVTAW